MKRINLSLAILVTALAGTAAAEKIAIVNVQRAVEESNAGKAAVTALKAEFDKKQKELETRSQELKQMDADLQRQASALKPEIVAQKKKELDQKVLQLQETYMRAQKELQEKEQKATFPIADRVSRAVGVIAEREKLTLVLRSEAVVWPSGMSQLDITNEVIRKVNETK